MADMSEKPTSPVRVPIKGTVIHGRFIKRYKRFFVDLELPSGEVVTGHTPNTGSMKGLLVEGAPCIFAHDPSPKRKLQYTLWAIDPGTGMVGSHTGVPNKLIAEAAKQGALSVFAGYDRVRTEVKYGTEGKSRIDVLLEKTNPEGVVVAKKWIEVKNTTLREGDEAQFPDAVTTRGQKHLRELMAQVDAGDAAAMVYVVQRTDCVRFAPAAAVDPTYATLLREAAAKGVEVVAVTASIEDGAVVLGSTLPVAL